MPCVLGKKKCPVGMPSSDVQPRPNAGAEKEAKEASAEAMVAACEVSSSSSSSTGGAELDNPPSSSSSSPSPRPSSSEDPTPSAKEAPTSPTSAKPGGGLDEGLWDSGQEWILIFDRLLKHPRGRSRGCKCDMCEMDKAAGGAPAYHSPCGHQQAESSPPEDPHQYSYEQWWPDGRVDHRSYKIRCSRFLRRRKFRTDVPTSPPLKPLIIRRGEIETDSSASFPPSFACRKEGGKLVIFPFVRARALFD